MTDGSQRKSAPVGRLAGLDAYDEAMSHGPRAYTAYAHVLHAIADGKRVEWFDGQDWTYQHPSHTLAEVCNIVHMPERYRVADDPAVGRSDKCTPAARDGKEPRT